MEETINLSDHIQTIKRYKWFIIVFVFLSTFISVVTAKLLPNIYEASAIIMPLDQNNKTPSSLSTLGGAGALIGSALEERLGGGGKAQLMVILSSRTLAETVINKNRNKILTALYPDSWNSKTETWKEKNPKKVPQLIDISTSFRGYFTFSDSTKKPTITIRAEFKDPAIAADMVNLYIDALDQYLNTHTLTQTRKNRMFIEHSLEQKNKELLEAGKELARFYKTNVLSKVGSSIDVDTSLVPESTEASNKPDHDRRVKDVPQQVYLQYLTQQQITLSEVTTMLASEYEKAKIQENKENPSFQVIDAAEVPTKKIKPARTKIVVMSFIMSLLFAVVSSFFLASMWSGKMNKTFN